MKTLVVYDSKYGNTAAVARAIASGLGSDVTMRTVAEVTPADLITCDRLVVGSPTQGGHPAPALDAWLKQLPDGSLSGVRVAAFDTRFGRHDHGVGLGLVMAVLGFAADRIARRLEAAGGRRWIAPQGFIVLDKEGPLAPGELQRASHWLAAWAEVTPKSVTLSV